jgi:nucleotide-binding universal stress UspA family protein
MITIHRILCPVDFSEYSLAALRQALAIARWHEADVTVLHVEDRLLQTARADARLRPHVSGSPEDDVRTFAETAGASVRPIDVHVTAGEPAPAIVEHAKRETADLIVMGTQGRSGLSRVLLGSVAERVVREAPCPVMTVPPGAQASRGVAPFDPILCASDFSPSCRRALDLAVAMAQEADARLLLLHAIEAPPVRTGVLPMPATLEDAIDRADLRRSAAGRLRRGLPEDAVFRCHPEVLVVDGHPADSILQVAHDEDVKLIVMGAQTRGTIDRMLFGSTTRRVTQGARSPVLSVRADEHAAPWVAWPDSAREEVASA